MPDVPGKESREGLIDKAENSSVAQRQMDAAATSLLSVSASCSSPAPLGSDTSSPPKSRTLPDEVAASPKLSISAP